MKRPAIVRCCSLVALVTVLLAGCGSNHKPAGTDSESTVAIDTTPATEGPTTELPQPDGGGISVSVASLPIGGNGSGGGVQQCADVGLIGVPDRLPPDVSVSVTGQSLNPEGIFEFGGDTSACEPPGESVCPSTWTWTASTRGSCLVVVTQIDDVTDPVSVTLNIAGTVHCTKQDSCDAVTSAGGSQIEFQAQPGVVSTSPPPSTPDTGASTPDASGSS
jgi:hypothetical protein